MSDSPESIEEAFDSDEQFPEERRAYEDGHAAGFRAGMERAAGICDERAMKAREDSRKADIESPYREPSRVPRDAAVWIEAEEIATSIRAALPEGEAT